MQSAVTRPGQIMRRGREGGHWDRTRVIPGCWVTSEECKHWTVNTGDHWWEWGPPPSITSPTGAGQAAPRWSTTRPTPATPGSMALIGGSLTMTNTSRWGLWQSQLTHWLHYAPQLYFQANEETNSSSTPSMSLGSSLFGRPFGAVNLPSTRWGALVSSNKFE